MLLKNMLQQIISYFCKIKAGSLIEYFFDQG